MQTLAALNKVSLKEDEEPVEEGEEGGENDGGTDGEDKEYNPTVNLRKWLECIDAVSEITRLNWSQVFDITALEFFAYIAYYNYKMRKKEAADKAAIAKFKKGK